MSVSTFNSEKELLLAIYGAISGGATPIIRGNTAKDGSGTDYYCLVDGDGKQIISPIELQVHDIQIGAVEIKDHTTTDRQRVKSDGTDIAAVVMQNNAPEHKVTMSAPTFATIGASSGVALAANANRKYASFVNDSDAVIYLAFGAAAVVGSGERLNSGGGSFEINNSNLTTQVVNAISTGASKNLCVQEGE